MENYILILLTILVVLVITIVYFGYRQLGHLRIIVNKNSINISGLQSYLSKMSPQDGINTSRNIPISTFMHEQEDSSDISDSSFSSENDLSSVDNINVSDSEDTVNETVNDNVNETVNKIVNNIDDMSVNSIINGNINVSTNINDDVDDDSFMDDIDQDTKVIELKSNDKRVIKRLSPNEIPKNFELGHEQVSENDGKIYEIVENKTGIKRWKLKK